MIGLKCILLQEDFLKENIFVQFRTVLDKRNLTFDVSLKYNFAS